MADCAANHRLRTPERMPKRPLAEVLQPHVIEANIATRLWARVEKTDGCWNWTGPVDRYGYGYFKGYGGGRRAHQSAFALANGYLPPTNEDIDHLCRNSRCVRPEHLQHVQHRINMVRGATVFGEQARRARCPRGHLYDTVGKRSDGRTFRDCKRCMKVRQKRAHDRAKAVIVKS